MNRLVIYPIISIALSCFQDSLFSATPPPIEDIKDEPVIYTGDEQADKRWHHAGFKNAIGVHKIQVYRATRNHPLEGDQVGWTYNHAPMLAYWQGRFWMNYVSKRIDHASTHGFLSRSQWATAHLRLL